MKDFCVLIRGENFFVKLEDAARLYGFYTSRTVRAADHAGAEALAIESIRRDDRLRGMVLNDPSDPPRLFAEEITEASSSATTETSGLAWFQDESTLH